jgi:excisionase family DNA binding protein
MTSTTIELKMPAPPIANQVNEACRRLGIARNLLYQLINAGQIKIIKIGKRTLIPETELVRFVESRIPRTPPEG